MDTPQPVESYVVTIESSVTTKHELFSRITDKVHLGLSRFSGWDAFEEFLLSTLETRNIVIQVVNEDLSGLSESDRRLYSKVMEDVAREFPQKLFLEH